MLTLLNDPSPLNVDRPTKVPWAYFFFVLSLKLLQRIEAIQVESDLFLFFFKKCVVHWHPRQLFMPFQDFL